MKIVCKVYITTCLVDGKIYIGRAPCNSPYYFGSGKKIVEYVKKYGRENFKREILFECDSQAKASVLEKYFIRKYNSTNPEIGLNIKKGGEIPGILGKKWSKEAKERLKKSLIGRKFSEKHKKYLSDWAKRRIGELNSNWGNKWSEEQKNNLSEKNSGKKWTEEQRQRHILHTTGQKRSEETKKKISDALIGRKLSEEHKKKIGDSHRGKILSEEQRKFLSEINKGKIISRKTRKKMSLAQSGEKSHFYGVRKFGEENPFWGVKHTKLTRDNMRDNMLGRNWITNGVNNKFIKKNSKIPKGFRYGRALKNKHSRLIK